MDLSQVKSLPGVERVYFLDEIDSTNSFARGLRDAPAQGLYAVVAARQTAGRGQRGNAFFSDTDGGLWLSLVVRVPAIDSHFQVNRALALAACDAVGECAGVACLIKWPNDICVGERKLGGILLEATDWRPDVLVAGIGLNVNVDIGDFPETLRSLATSTLIASGKRVDLARLLACLLHAFVQYRSMGFAVAHERYRLRLVGLGRTVTIGDRQGRFVDVREDGEACVDTGPNVVHFSSGPMRFAQPGPDCVRRQEAVSSAAISP